MNEGQDHRGCIMCDVALTGRRDKVFCGPNCTQLYYHRQRLAAQGIEWPRRGECVVCGTTYQKNKAFQKFCSTLCRWRNKHQSRITKGMCGRCGKLPIHGKFRNCDPCRDKYNKRNFTQKYGITHLDYDRMVEDRKGLCDICGKPDDRKDGRRISVDHDHKTGKVRGLLCNGCNARLGWYENHKKEIAGHLRKGR